MRTYLVVIDETEEAEKALRYAARLAERTESRVDILALIPNQEFVAWGSVQTTIENEAREHAEAMIARAMGVIDTDSGLRPGINVKRGDPATAIREAIRENGNVTALVLCAAPSGSPGPLVQHFTGTDAGALPCPIIIVPGALSVDDLERLI